MERGEIWWADLPNPVGAGPGYHRPVLIIQADRFNFSNISTLVVALFTTNLRLASAPGNIFFSMSDTGLPRDSVLNVSQLLTVDRMLFTDYIGILQPSHMRQVEASLRLVLDL
ncbi:MAG: type II toxin-antitoxin system PemK/MazF family toxin [Caldilineaceae bacterium]